MPIDPAILARLKDLLTACDKSGNPYGPEHATLFVEARQHLPALLEAAERCERATEFLVTAPGTFAIVIRKCFGYRLPHEPMWKVEQSGSVLSTDGDWEHEPQPSSRDDEFYRRCRFNSFEEADAAARKAIDADRRAGRSMPKRSKSDPAVQAKRAVNRIVADLNDRRGLKWEWQKIEPSIQREIKKEWAALILEEITEARQSAARECAEIANDHYSHAIWSAIRERFNLDGK